MLNRDSIFRTVDLEWLETADPAKINLKSVTARLWKTVTFCMSPEINRPEKAARAEAIAKGLRMWKREQGSTA